MSENMHVCQPFNGEVDGGKSFVFSPYLILYLYSSLMHELGNHAV